MSSGGYSAIAVPVGTAEIVEVVAPSTLAEGYTFEAIYNGVTFPVTVPPGGVKEGQKFSVPFSPEVGAVTETTPAFPGDREAPHGRWKDGLFDCLRFGILHPSFLNACCCPQILMAQVLTRLKRDWLGDPAPEFMWRRTFRIVLTIVICYFILSAFLSPPGPNVVYDEQGKMKFIHVECPVWQRVFYNIITFCFGLYTLIVLMKTRRAVRNRYEIPQTRCWGFEDLCCAFWCGCCTVSQLARQTANYQDRRAVCCSDTGLPATAPVLIV